MAEIITLGELLIDFVPTVSGVSLIEAPAFKKAAGGAPANVAVGLAKLGASSGFMGKVGDDAFGRFLADTLAHFGVDVSALRFSSEARTALAFVSLSAEGERDFLFYRHPSADMLYAPEDVDVDYIRRGRLFHFGSISLIGEPSRTATLHAVEMAKLAGLRISYDPNLRLNLWPDAETAKRGMLTGWSHVHYAKVSRDELAFLTGTDPGGLNNLSTLAAAARSLWHQDLRLVVVTHGRSGCSYVTADLAGQVPGFVVDPVDTTGAGDGFVAGLLKGLLDSPRADLAGERLEQVCRCANAVGALTTTERGAIPALPTAEQVAAFMAASPV